jgi:hypothetical protein
LNANAWPAAMQIGDEVECSSPLGEQITYDLRISTQLLTNAY